MALPPRHGHRHSRAPVPIVSGPASSRVAATVAKSTPVAAEPAPAHIVPVRQVNFWLRNLPREQVTHLVVRDEIRYNHALNIGGELLMGGVQVADQYVWVLTDVEYYALAPSSGMPQIPTSLSAGALVGLLRFDLLFGGNDPVKVRANVMSPYSTPDQATSSTGGWPWLQRPFGTQRMPSFAVYAHAGTTINARVTVEDVPRFPITKLGVNMHGFTISATLFPQIFEATPGG